MNLFRQIGRDPRRPARRIVVLTSGPIRSGKTTLAEGLQRRLQADVVRTKSVLVAEYGAHPMVRLRRRLQDLGDRLDRETDGRWVAAATRRRVATLAPRTRVIVDSVRIPRQIEHLRELPDVRIVQVHLTARLKTLEARYEATAPRDEQELPTYAAVRENETEARIEEMRKLTRWRFNTSYVRPRLLITLVEIIIRGIAAGEAARRVALALALGAVPVGMLMAPIAWFWFTHLENETALIVSAVTFLFFAATVGSALTRLSPIERDAPPRPKGSEPPEPPDRVAPPAGSEVERARALSPSDAR
jgi:adenylylsulfate kinase-like enzyme